MVAAPRAWLARGTVPRARVPPAHPLPGAAQPELAHGEPALCSRSEPVF